MDCVHFSLNYNTHICDNERDNKVGVQPIAEIGLVLCVLEEGLHQS